jgi:hypothetical protein
MIIADVAVGGGVSVDSEVAVATGAT